MVGQNAFANVCNALTNKSA